MANEYLLYWESSAIQSYRVSNCLLTIFMSMIQQAVEESFAVEKSAQSIWRAVARSPSYLWRPDSSQASGTMAALSSVASPHVLFMNTSGRKTDR